MKKHLTYERNASLFRLCTVDRFQNRQMGLWSCTVSTLLMSSSSSLAFFECFDECCSSCITYLPKETSQSGVMVNIDTVSEQSIEGEILIFVV